MVVAALAAVAAACGAPGGDESTLPPAAQAGPTPSAPPPPAEPDLHGFIYPIAGGCLPASNRLMPNAPRTYRNGFHEGIDFYHSDNCTKIVKGTDVIAAKAGTVIRADVDYVDVTEAQVAAYLADPNTEASLDQFRGRQVWIDHGAGVVTRYCHLSGVAPGIVPGMRVMAGQLVGFVGESGTPSSVRNPGHEYHLHFEVRVGDSFLGHALPEKTVRASFVELFGTDGR
jgi:murein DD-endopeptidase MepM/ murein hydrolase activator NlpD